MTSVHNETIQRKCIDSLRPGDAYMPHWTATVLLQIMLVDCRRLLALGLIYRTDMVIHNIYFRNKIAFRLYAGVMSLNGGTAYTMNHYYIYFSYVLSCHFSVCIKSLYHVHYGIQHIWCSLLFAASPGIYLWSIHWNHIRYTLFDPYRMCWHCLSHMVPRLHGIYNNILICAWYTLLAKLRYGLWPLLLTWFNFNPSMDK